MENIKRLKKATISWAKDWKAKQNEDFNRINEELQNLESIEEDGYTTQETKDKIIHLEKLKNQILLAKEEEWRLKSRAIWIKAGDKNTKFFHNYAKGRKSANTIWSLKNGEGREAKTFEALSALGHSHFQNQYADHELTEVVEETRIKGEVYSPFNATFIALIPKKENPESFEDFRPISLCNSIYKIIAKVIALRIKPILSKHISSKQFGFLNGRQIHEAIGVAQEVLHSVKQQNKKGVVLKIDLSKAFDRINWIYIRLLLTHLGFKVDFISWIMGCITNVSYAILINGATTPFFKGQRGLRQGYPLSPLLFLLVAEGLSQLILKARREGKVRGIEVAVNLNISHLLFVDDILIFTNGTPNETAELRNIFDIFMKATGMQINSRKSQLIVEGLNKHDRAQILSHFPFELSIMQSPFKHLGFWLKPNAYKKEDWNWLTTKIEARISHWSYKWLSRAGRLTLIKSVLLAIPVYWAALTWVPKGTLEKIRRICSRFLWAGSKESVVLPWVAWEKVARPKDWGGWGIKSLPEFSLSLAAKSGWRLIKLENLWTRVIKRKYIDLVPLEDWIRNPAKNKNNASVIWKETVESFRVIEQGLAWKIGNGQNVKIGKDPWVGCNMNYALSPGLTQHLESRGIYFLYQVEKIGHSTIWGQAWKDGEDLELEQDWRNEWNTYTQELIRSQSRLKDSPDELIWAHADTGEYSQKSGYKYLMSRKGWDPPEWWSRHLWKLKAPPKAKILFWCILRRKIPTWDILQSRFMHGPGRCTLCKTEAESINHLFLNCQETKKIWGEAGKLLNKSFDWAGGNMTEAWSNWWQQHPEGNMRNLPLIISWGVWIAKNKSIFQDMEIPRTVSATLSVSIFSSIPEPEANSPPRQIKEIQIKEGIPWAFFDGPSQNNKAGAGIVIHENPEQLIKASVGLGSGTNNFAELAALKLLLCWLIQRNILTIQIFGDSLNVIKWVNGHSVCKNQSLKLLLDEIQVLKLSFNCFSICHIYKELNDSADHLSKEGLQQDMVSWKIEQVNHGQTSSTDQPPYLQHF
eukprot:PITA_23807